MAATHAAAFAGSRTWSAAEFADLLAMNGTFVCGDARAFALVRVALDEAELLTMATRPEHRRRGIARALMAEWQARAFDDGARQAFLEVAADNAPAIALYSDCGFTRIGLRRSYYARSHGAAVDAVLMRRALT